VDLNRSGVALMEIVSKPDMRSPDEAGAYVRKLRSILRYVGSCDGNMEQGSMRADVNVSVRRPGAEFGTRTETKNVNSVRFIMAAIEYEANRQVDILESGGSIVQETRLFDPDKNETRSLRSKEDAHDYRYFPDPDLLPLELDESFLQDCRASLPELPDAKRRRYEQELGLPAYQASELVAEVGRARFYDKLVERTAAMSGLPKHEIAKRCANLLLNDILGYLNRLELPGGIDPVTGESVGLISIEQGAQLINLVFEGVLSGPLYKQVFEGIAATEIMPADYVEQHNLKQTSDTGAIEKVIADVLAANQDKVAEYRGGKDKLFGFFVGQTMKAMQGKGNPAVVNELLKKALG
jgi:aspartyl-tRNA(Asn)/glutamyl-tRNA(Gln) amidotransferase subunit B